MNQSPETDDPIIAEIRRVRDELSDRFNGDIRAISAEMRRQAELLGRPGITRPPKRMTESTKRVLPAETAM